MAVKMSDLKEWGITKILDDMMCDELFGKEKTMTDDLVKRLRAGCVTGNYEGLEFIEWAKSNATMDEAADRIEKLKAALREIVGFLEDPTGGQHVADMRRASDIARKALERKDGP
jgi:hypothetical protein